jgi:hypothetical protein
VGQELDLFPLSVCLCLLIGSFWAGGGGRASEYWGLGGFDGWLFWGIRNLPGRRSGEVIGDGLDSAGIRRGHKAWLALRLLLVPCPVRGPTEWHGARAGATSAARRQIAVSFSSYTKRRRRLRPRLRPTPPSRALAGDGRRKLNSDSCPGLRWAPVRRCSDLRQQHTVTAAPNRCTVLTRR